MVVMSANSVPYHKARELTGANKPAEELEGQLGQARPMALLWSGAIALGVLLSLMVFKPF